MLTYHNIEVRNTDAPTTSKKHFFNTLVNSQRYYSCYSSLTNVNVVITVITCKLDPIKYFLKFIIKSLVNGVNLLALFIVTENPTGRRTTDHTQNKKGFTKLYYIKTGIYWLKKIL